MIAVPDEPLGSKHSVHVGLFEVKVNGHFGSATSQVCLLNGKQEGTIMRRPSLINLQP